MTRDIPAHEVQYGHNIYWQGNLYTVTAVQPNYDDETTTIKVAYPRHLNKAEPLVREITCHLQNLITKL